VMVVRFERNARALGMGEAGASCVLGRLSRFPLHGTLFGNTIPTYREREPGVSHPPPSNR
jgi:hypothetical protein